MEKAEKLLRAVGKAVARTFDKTGVIPPAKITDPLQRQLVEKGQIPKQIIDITSALDKLGVPGAGKVKTTLELGNKVIAAFGEEELLRRASKPTDFNASLPFDFFTDDVGTTLGEIPELFEEGSISLADSLSQFTIDIKDTMGNAVHDFDGVFGDFGGIGGSGGGGIDLGDIIFDDDPSFPGLDDIIFDDDPVGFGGGFGGGFDDVLSIAAKGGVLTNKGMASLNRYAAGGVARSPQLALFGEGSLPEAFVPLPDGRTIPVTLRGGTPLPGPSAAAGGAGVNVTYNIDARGAEAGVEKRIRDVLAQTQPGIIAEFAASRTTG